MKTKNPNVTRRSFLKASGAAVVAPTILPSSVFGANAPSNRITIGMIGVGRQAHHVNLPQFLHAPDAQVVAVCDVDAWRLGNAQTMVNDHYAKATESGSYSGCDAYGDFRDVIARADIDAVMISTPDHWHVPIAMAAIEAGKDVSSEKPLTMSIHEGRVLANAVKKHDRVFRVDSEFRSHDYFRRTCEIVRNGRLGKLHTIRAGVPAGDIACGDEPAMPVPEELNYDMWIGPAREAPYTVKRVHPPKDYSRPGWMRIQDYGLGMITNWGAHLIDIAQWGHGTDDTGPTEVQGTGTYPDGGLWDVLLAFDAHFAFADGVQLHYVMDEPYVRFEGDKGWIQANYGGNVTASSDAILNTEIGEDEIHLRSMGDKEDFLHCVKTRERTMEDAEVGQRTTTICHLAHISIQLGGEKLQWDPENEAFIGNDRANAMRDRPYIREPWTI